MRCVGISVEEARQVCASHVLLPVVQTILFVCGVAVAFVIAQGTARAQDNPASLFGTEKKPQLIAEVPLDLRGSHPVIRAEFLGEERRFVIDTGASITFVDESFRGQLGSSSNEDVADSSSGDVHVKVFGKRTIFIGAKPFSGLIGIGPPDFDFDSLGSQLAGTIGMDCFKDFVLELNPSDKVMRVYDHAPNSLAKEGESFPVRNSINCIMARGTLPDVGSEEFLIDSGGQSSMLLRAKVFDRLTKADEICKLYSTKMSSAAGTQTTQAGQLQKFSLGKDQLRLVDVKRTNSISSIGWRLLRRYIITIDFPHKKLYLRPSVYFDSPEVFDKSGLLLRLRGDGFYAAECDKGSPAWNAGLQGYDSIRSVNEKLAEEYSQHELEQLLSRDGETVKIAAVRGEVSFNAEFRLHDFRSLQSEKYRGEPKLLAEVSVRNECDDLLIPVQCFGETRLVEFDLNASVTMFDNSLRPHLGAPVAVRDVTLPRGKSHVDVFRDTTVSMGDYGLKVSRVICDDLEPLCDSRGQQIAGIIGLNSLVDLVVELDFAGKSVRLYDRVPSDVVETSECLPISIDRRGLSLTALLPGYGSEAFKIASTSECSLVLRDAVFSNLRTEHEIGRVHAVQVSRHGSNKLTTERGVLSRLKFGPFVHKNIDVVEAGDSMIGLSYLRRYIAVFDFPNKQLYLKESKYFNHPKEPLDASGIGLSLHDGQVIVSSCHKDGPAVESGLAEKDQILEVNGKPATEYSLFQLRSLLKQEGETLKISARRENQPRFSVEFKLRDYREYLPDRVLKP